MTSSTSDEPRESTRGAASESRMSDVEREEKVDYLDVEINLLDPATPYMRDHQRVIWIAAALWTLTTFGPVTLTRLAPGLMTTRLPLLGFPFHYFAIAIGGPTAALLLSVWYARKRDRIDEKYGIEQPTPGPGPGAEAETETEDVAATDGGAVE